MTEPTPKLQRRADALLQDFPLPEPDFEALAEAIQTRVAGSVGASRDDLLDVPDLAAVPGEPSPESVRGAPPQSSFAEMARKSVQKSKSDSAEDAKELLAATAQSRRPNAAMVERVRAAGRAPASATPVPATEALIESAPRTSGVMARSSIEKTRSERGLWIGLAGGALALAAGVALLVGSADSPAPATAALLAAEKTARDQTPSAAEAQPAAERELAADSGGALSPEALAAAPVGKAPATPGKLASGGLSAARGAAALSPAPGALSANPNAVVLAEDPEQTPGDSAPAKPAPAAPADEPKLRPAQGGDDASVVTTPSAGAVSAALGSVRGGAQACLAGQTEPVTAVVTFASNGSVARVSAGGPAGACIQAALSKARIQPFARDSFSASTTIRPP